MPLGRYQLLARRREIRGEAGVPQCSEVRESIYPVEGGAPGGALKSLLPSILYGSLLS